MVALRPIASRFILTDSPTAPASRRWSLDEPRRSPSSLGVETVVESDFDAALSARDVDARYDAGDWLLSYRRRPRWRVAGVSANPGSLVEFQGALPGFRDFYPQRALRARLHHGDLARRRPPLRLRGVRWTASRAASICYTRKTVTRSWAALQLPRQGGREWRCARR